MMGLVAGERDEDEVVALITAGRDREAAQRGAALGAAPEAPLDTDGGAMDPLAQFDQLGPVLGGVIAGIQPDQLDNQTPCAAFTVRGVLEHMTVGATMFAAAFRGDDPSEPNTTDVLVGIQTALDELADALHRPGSLDKTISAPFGDLDGATFARFVVLDGLVHGWDMSVATGQAYDPPAELVAEAEAFARQAVDPLRDGSTFADAVEPAAGATPIEKLAAYTGRRNLEEAR